jgi:hypothetical protein
MMDGKVRNKSSQSSSLSQRARASATHALWMPLLTHIAAGQSQFLTTPALAKPLDFGHLSLNDPEYDAGLPQSQADSDARLMEMMAAQAAHHSASVLEDEKVIANDEKLSETEKKEKLQKALAMAASNGDVEKVQNILKEPAKQYVDINAPDEDGTPPLIYASCFVSPPNARAVAVMADHDSC